MGYLIIPGGYLCGSLHMADLTTIEDPQTIEQQREQAKAEAIGKWGDQYYDTPRTGLVYRLAIQGAPDGKPHPTFQPPPRPSPEDEEPPNIPEAPKVKFSCLTYTTFYHITTGHAFVGEYIQRFYPQLTLEQIACPCGRLVQTVEHVLLDCPLYTATRCRHLAANGRP
jgi:hypothetical protein